MYELRIFESDEHMTQVGNLVFDTYSDLNKALRFLLANNDFHKWEFEIAKQNDGEEELESIMHFEYIAE